MSQQRIKKHTVREDGRIFNRYLDGKEVWLTPEQFAKREQYRKNYYRMCSTEYRKRQQQKNIMDRNYIGKYDFASNKYFSGISTSGKEVWVTKEKLDELRKKANERRKKFCQQLQHEETNLKVGDTNPENPNEVVGYFIGKKPYFTSLENYKILKQNRKISQRKQKIKASKLRKEFLERLQNRIVRGTKHEKDNLIFWRYGSTGKEVWIDPNDYNKRILKEKEKKKKYRKPKYIK